MCVSFIGEKFRDVKKKKTGEGRVAPSILYLRLVSNQFILIASNLFLKVFVFLIDFFVRFLHPTNYIM
jgi:hypothetical protein